MMRCTIQFTVDSVSAARRLFRLVPCSLELIAPEKAHDLKRAVDNLELRILESPVHIHHCTVWPPVIEFSSRVLELLWGEAYAFLSLYTKELSGTRPTGQQIDLTRKPELARALDVLKWTVEEIVSHGKRPWPTELPSPQQDPSGDDLLALRTMWL